MDLVHDLYDFLDENLPTEGVNMSLEADRIDIKFSEYELAMNSFQSIVDIISEYYENRSSLIGLSLHIDKHTHNNLIIVTLK